MGYFHDESMFRTPHNHLELPARRGKSLVRGGCVFTREPVGRGRAGDFIRRFGRKLLQDGGARQRPVFIRFFHFPVPVL